MLLKNDYDVVCADSVDQGLRELCRFDPHVVVLDIKMPDRSGIEGLREIRRVDPDVSVIMLTGYASLDTAQEAVRLGANDYMKKPFDTDEMRATVNRYVRRTKLARRKARASQELESLNTELREDLDRKEHFASLGQASSALIHDLRSPLTVIHGYVGLLMQQLREGDLAATQSDETQVYLEAIEKSVQRCQEMSTVWRDLLKQNADRMGPVPIDEVLEEAVASAGPLAKKAGGEIVVSRGPGSCHVHGDATQLFRAFQNLLGNAIQALPPRAGQVRVNWSARGQQVAVRIEDNGCGIPDDQLASVFEPYSSGKAPGTGLGLGLFITRKILTDHGGTVTLENLPYRGVAASVSLPAMATSPGAEPAPGIALGAAPCPV